jgi:hypothetical protein
MSRRKRVSESSLELLLDTICNTFGGVLFVAILIVVMLRMTSKAQVESNTAQVSEVEQLELERQQADLHAILDTLRRATADLDQSPATADPVTADAFDELKSKQKSRHDLLQRRLETLGSIAERQTRINRTAGELALLDSKEREAGQKREAAEATLKAEVTSRSQQVEYSRIHWSGKGEIQTDLRYGRFRIWHLYGPSGNRLGLNTEEYVVLKETATEIRTTQIPQSGTLVADTTEATRELTTRLSRFKTGRDYIEVTVWPDSYEYFHILKKVLVQSGFEYRLIPAKQGDTFRDRGGSSDGVQ